VILAQLSPQDRTAVIAWKYWLAGGLVVLLFGMMNARALAIVLPTAVVAAGVIGYAFVLRNRARGVLVPRVRDVVTAVFATQTSATIEDLVVAAQKELNPQHNHAVADELFDALLMVVRDFVRGGWLVTGQQSFVDAKGKTRTRCVYRLAVAPTAPAEDIMSHIMIR
jgi:hypothetical protein